MTLFINNPLGGIIYGIDQIVELYNNIFNSESDVWVEFHDIIVFEGEDMITFAGRESGEFRKDNKTLALEIRTTRVLQYSNSDDQWYLIHHHGSIDDAELLTTYQKAINK
jgi:ketosteroid isomerase-like protein